MMMTRKAEKSKKKNKKKKHIWDFLDRSWECHRAHPLRTTVLDCFYFF